MFELWMIEMGFKDRIQKNDPTKPLFLIAVPVDQLQLFVILRHSENPSFVPSIYSGCWVPLTQ